MVSSVGLERASDRNPGTEHAVAPGAMEEFFVGLIGRLILTFFISRFIFLGTRFWNGGLIRLLAVHITSLAATVALISTVLSDGSELAIVRATALCFGPQLVWFATDTVKATLAYANRRRPSQRAHRNRSTD